MPSKLQQTALSFLEGFKTLSPDKFLAVLAPDAVHEFAPASVSPPPPKNPQTFVKHISGLREILSEFPVTPKEIFENEEHCQVTVWATSQAFFRDDLKDDGLSSEEWLYQGEYIFIFFMDESEEKIVRILEFLDSKGTERLRGLMSRATNNLQNTMHPVGR